MKSLFYKTNSRLTLLAALLGVVAMGARAAEPKITHSFLATGAETRIVSADGKVTWDYPRATRDGWVLPNGNILLALAGNGGGVVEVTPDKKIVLEYKGSQAEVDTAQRLPDGNTLLTEAGPKPRILELDSTGKVVKEVPLTTQLGNTHLQQRMTRKLPNGNYLVPHALEMMVKEYTPAGKVVWSAKTPNWPFTAIRLANGNTVVGCTVGNVVVELDAKGEIVWQVSNDDLPGKPLSDCCGVQRLPNGNTVITSYRTKPGEVRLTEVTREKKVVWTYTDDRPAGIHHFQILDTNGKPLEGAPLR
jgi:outer membrane protein assembly factor BamB